MKNHILDMISLSQKIKIIFKVTKLWYNIRVHSMLLEKILNNFCNQVCLSFKL